MADDKVKILLETWQLSEYIEIFERNKVTIEVMPEITEEMTKELITPVGHRASFIAKCRQHFRKRKFDALDSEVATSSKKKHVEVGVAVEVEEDDTVKNAPSEQSACNMETMFVSQTFPPVEDILKKTRAGQSILLAYKNTSELSPKNRDKIVDIVIAELLNRTQRADNDVFETVGKKIIETFTTEVLTTYYIPPIKKKDSKMKKSMASRGKIPNKWRNALNVIKVLEHDGDSENSDTVEFHDESIDVDTQNSVKWLQLNAYTALFDVAITHWKKTSELRQREIKANTDHKLQSTFDKWEILKQPRGYVLIDADFTYLNLTKLKADIETWQTFFENIKILCRVNQKDDTAKALLDLLTLKEINNDTKVTVQLLLLPHLIPPKSIIKTDKKKVWRPSIGDAKDSIIMHATIEGDVDRLKQERIDKMHNHRLSVQPYIIVIGPTLCNITSSYICIDQTLYAVDSTIQALDICFKAFHVLHASYPIESEHLWLLMQKCFYDFTTSWDKKLSYTEHIIDKLTKLRKTSLVSDESDINAEQ